MSKDHSLIAASKKHGLSTRTVKALFAEFGVGSEPRKWAAGDVFHGKKVETFTDALIMLLRLPGMGKKAATEAAELFVKLGLVSDDKGSSAKPAKRKTDGDALNKIKASRKVMRRHVSFLGGKVTWVRTAEDVLVARRKRQKKTIDKWKKHRAVARKSPEGTAANDIPSMTPDELEAFRVRMGLQKLD